MLFPRSGMPPSDQSSSGGTNDQFHDGFAIVKPAPRHRKVVSVNCAYCSGGSLFEVRDNRIRLEVWCYFVQFLYNRLDEQECMRRNLVLFLVYSYIPARQWIDICNNRCSILSRFSHFHVLHFPPLQHGAAFSCPASSCLAFSASPSKQRYYCAPKTINTLTSVDVCPPSTHHQNRSFYRFYVFTSYILVLLGLTQFCAILLFYGHLSVQEFLRL